MSYPRLHHKSKKAQFSFMLKGYFLVTSVGIFLDPEEKGRMLSGINFFVLRET